MVVATGGRVSAAEHVALDVIEVCVGEWLQEPAVLAPDGNFRTGVQDALDQSGAAASRSQNEQRLCFGVGQGVFYCGRLWSQHLRYRLRIETTQHRVRSHSMIQPKCAAGKPIRPC